MGYTMKDAGAAEKHHVFRINLIDVSVIVVLVLAVLVAVSYFTDFSLFGLGGEKRSISYTVEFDTVSAEPAGSVKSGDGAVSVNGATSMGTVVSANIQPAVDYVYDPESGEIKAVGLPAADGGKAPVKLVVRLDVSADYIVGEGYSVDGKRISVGTPIELNFAGFSGVGNCVAVVEGIE